MSIPNPLAPRLGASTLTIVVHLPRHSASGFAAGAPADQVRVLVDTNVLIALVDRSDKLHFKASSDLQKLAKSELRTTDAALCESVFALARADQRGRLSLLLERLPIAPLVVDHPSALRREIFAWLAKYAEHDPDYADAELCVLAARDKRLRIWTYDSEFTRVWRKSSGRRVALIGQA